MSESIDPVDQQLIELLEQKSPEELSFEELELLRQRLATSPELRTALAQHLQTESYLTQVLGNFTISPETIITRAQAEQAAQARPWQWLAGGVICLLLIGVLVGVFRSAMTPPVDAELADATRKKTEQEAATAETDPAKTSTEQPAVESPEIADPTNDKPVDPIVAADDPPGKPKFLLSLPAEKFDEGNVKVDNSQFGNATNVVIHSGDGNKKSLVEYRLTFPRDGKYYIHLRYASADARPLKAVLNGKKLSDNFAGEATGGPSPQHQRWSTAGQFAFKKGKNVFRLETAEKFPHLNRIVISSAATISDETAPPMDPTQVAQVEPWESSLRVENPPPYLATAFTDFDTAKSLPQVPDILRWFETVPNQQKRVGETHTKVGKCAEFEGVFQLRWPWQENAALRLSLENHNRLRMHFYHGTQGVTLVYYQDEGYGWSAYATTRKDASQHAPETLALTATDEGRCARTEMRFGGPIDLRWHAGELILSRGDIVLLRAPLVGLPQDAYFDGRCAFHGIAVVPTKDVPPAAPAVALQDKVLQPASLAWLEQLTEGAKVEKHGDGSLELIGDNAKGSGYITTPLNLATPSEIILELENASRGTGVFLTTEKPANHLAVRFAKNPRMNPPVLCAALRQDELREGDVGFWQERTMPSVRSDKQYVRLLSGAGMVRHWISADGVHWGEKEDPFVNQPAATHLCLHYVSAEPNCRIKLTKVIVRPLAALAQQADATLLAKAPVLNQGATPTIAQWIAGVVAAQPADVSASAWRRTCAIRALAVGCDAELGQRLVQLVLDDAEARDLPVDQLLALYHDAFLLLETRQNTAQANAAWTRYGTAAALAATRGQRPFSAVRHAMMTSPVSHRHNLPIANEKAIRWELLQLVHNGEWEEVLEFCQRLRFYQQHQRTPLVEWAESTASRQLPGRAGLDLAVTRLRSSWRPLLVEELSKDTYNVLAEMQAILDSDAFDDAAKMITSISPDAVSGVAPHGKDRQLLVSLPSAIRLAVRDYPQLEQFMNEKYGPLAQLRVRQSITASNVAAVDLAAVQFEATEAAAEAHRWLGDRALSSGQFARAIAEYERALRTASTSLKHELTARIRLAAAMQGRDLGAPVTRPVVFGEMSLSPAEFEAIIVDMKNANANGNAQRVLSADEQRIFPAPAPTGYEAVVRSRLDGQVGQDPNAEVTRDINALKINWAERQIATLVEGNLLYVSNRFHIAAYNLDNGQRLWQTQPIPGNMMRSREWTLIPMRPLIVGNTIFARLLYGASPTLAAFEKTTGKLLWSSEMRQNEFLASDPMLIQGQLLALTVVRADQGQSSLRLTMFDRDSGEPMLQHSLARLNEVWWSRRAAEVTALDDGLIATLGGITVCCDASGNLRWIRRPVSLPPEEEPSWIRQYFERPLVVQGRAYLSQPGVRAVQCVDAETGRLLWSKTIPDIETVIGTADDRLVMRTENAFLALHLADGKELWRQSRPDVLEGALLGGAGGFAYVERMPTKANKDRFQPRLVWVDLATGKTKATFALTNLEDPDPHLGPLVAYKDRVFAFWGKAQNDPSRDLLEFVPKADAPVSPPLAMARDAWASQTDQALRQGAERAFPEWSLLAAGSGGESGWRDDVLGEKDVLGVYVRKEHPTVFAREFAQLPGGKLRLRFNHRIDQDWKIKLSAQFAGQTLWAQEIGKDQAPQQWKDYEVDLSRFAGRSGTLAVRAEYVSDTGEMLTWWKRLEISP